MITYRPIEATDWPRILEIQRMCYTEALRESLAALKSRWLASPEACFVAEKGADILGYALAHPWQDLDAPSLDLPLHASPCRELLYMHDVAVTPASRKTGVAGLLIRALIARAAAWDLPQMALTSVQGSAPFWEKHGFQREDFRGDLSSYGKDAAYMKKRLR